MLPAQRYWCGDANQAARRSDQIFDRGVTVADAAEGGLHLIDELLPGFCQSDRAGGAAHQ